jgi:hypothetical protein
MRRQAALEMIYIKDLMGRTLRWTAAQKPAATGV